MADVDVTDWKTYEEFASGIDTNRLPATDSFVGRTLEATLVDGTPLGVELDAPSHATVHGGEHAQGTGWCEVVDLGADTYFVDMWLDEQPRRSLTLIAGLSTRIALAIVSTIEDVKRPGVPRVRQEFLAGTVGDPAVPPGAPLPAPTRDLIGRRLLSRYSDNHLYEHVYLSSERYCWQCLEGVERGLADVDPVTMYRFDEDRYLVAFRECVLDVASVFFVDLRECRSTGKFFGITEDGVVENAPTGAYVVEIGPAAYPAGVEPV